MKFVSSGERSAGIAGAALAALLLLTTGCGDAARVDEDSNLRHFPHRTSRQNIKGGKVDNKHTAVVGMAVQRDRGFGICSGTLIARNLVLTAQHCVSELSNQGGIRCDQTEFTKTLDASSIPLVTTSTRVRSADSRYQVEKVITPPKQEVCENDIAMLRLSSNVPRSEAEPREPQLEEKVQRGDNYVAMGYGTTGQNESGNAGVRRRKENRSVRCAGQGCPNRFVQGGEFVGSGGTCQGDSGGGAYADNDDKVFGILSRGGGNCDTAIYTGVPVWKEFIRKHAQTAAQDGNYNPPSWVSTGPDKDNDGHGANYDNCPETKNKDQTDTDEDGKGDACDSDDDADGVPDGEDNCRKTPNSSQRDLDRDGKGNPCDDDVDGDEIPNKSDVCPTLANPDQETSGDDGTCKDSDGDRVADAADNCPNDKNWKQQDRDGDGKGAVCDSDEQKDSKNADTGTADAGASWTPEPVDEQNDSGCSVTETPRPLRLGGFVFAALFVLAGRSRREN